MLFVAGGDAGERWGAHVFRRNALRAWGRVESLPLSTDRGVGPAQWNYEALVEILEPPQRAVSTDGNRTLVAEIGGFGAVRVFERDPDSGVLMEQARLVRSEPESDDLFGTALSLSGDVAIVGAPRHGRSGAAYVFSRDPASGEWSQDALIPAPSPFPDSEFGAAVEIDGEIALVGHPGTAESRGILVEYTRDDARGTWTEQDRIAPRVRTIGDRFGSALAIRENEMLVGAPGTDQGRGGIHRFVRNRSDDIWQAVEIFSVQGSEPGFDLGSTVAIGGNVAVAGAPGADGGNGRAAVFSRPANGRWGEGEWLSLPTELPGVTGEEVLCVDGQAGRFECGDVDLLAFLPLSGLGLAPGSEVQAAGITDVWGWTDPETGREYALVARVGGASVVDVTIPSLPVYVGLLAVEGGTAQDIKVYADHAFFIGAGDTGMPVFDLRRLRSPGDLPVTLRPDARYTGIASAHNLVIDTQSGFAFPVGASGAGDPCGGGLHMIDIRNPITPTFAGCYTDSEGLVWAGRTHDAQCVEYSGPDADFRGRQICFASNETALRIVDITDKDVPLPIASATYPGMAYIHQGWLTEDQRYYYMNDELDETTGLAETTRTLVWDVAELDDPVLVAEHFGSTTATDHNLYIKGDRMYQANYQAGLRVLDISDPENPEEIGFFDTTPYDGNPPTMSGAWTAYPFFESGTIVVSSTQEGLFLLRSVRRPVF
ncbi:MAG TPA: choice-of-anchor B family protein [Gemmatimonadetes bacterium]|nr:choice-of-anchor B family protein [Gemmatimonadota bacterium]